MHLTGEKSDWQADGELRKKSPEYYLEKPQKMAIFQSQFLVFKINPNFDFEY
jgi:ethanolamine utilization cobalamin adenosyltransferase